MNHTVFINGLNELGIELTDHQLNCFEKYYELLIEWNQKFNLTSITEEDEVINKHFLDSLLIIKAFFLENCHSLLDIGTGAGFPGIPLKIVYPHLKVTLLDSVKKKITFLEEVCNQLSLEDVEAIHGRAEDLGQKDSYRESFDVVVSRAVSNLSTLSEYAIPFVKIHGFFVAYKAENCEAEVEAARSAIKTLGGKLVDIKAYEIPGTDIIRTYVLIQKDRNTKPQYPRKAGTPVKKPL